MRRKRITSHDVARLARVSRSTVSRALSDSASRLISSVTRERILRVAHELGYAPNAAAQQLRLGRARSIGLLLPSRIRPLAGTHAFTQFLGGITDVTDDARYNLVLCTTPANCLLAVQSGHLDGVLVLHPEMNDPWTADLLAHGTPVVLMNQAPPDVALSWVDVDNSGGVRDAIRHLVARGHRRIGFICGRSTSIVGKLRLQGYRDALAEASLIPDETLVVIAPEPLLAAEGDAAMRKLLALDDPPTAVFCYRDHLAFGALRALHEAGLRVRDDVAVVGFDDEPQSAYQHPPLTTVRADFYRKGQESARMLLALIKGDTTAPRTLLLPTELVVRGSS